MNARLPRLVIRLTLLTPCSAGLGPPAAPGAEQSRLAKIDAMAGTWEADMRGHDGLIYHEGLELDDALPA